ncbi:MAG: host attachment protein [Deltaproteobacteria bacterium]|nr:host attachment protein [Deltaproteobacteria bacterium]
MNATTNTWILVASRTGARIYEAEKGRRPTLLETIDHPSGRRQNQDIDSDRPGRTFERMGDGRHALGRGEDPHEHLAVTFAHDLAERLHRGRVDNKMQRLFLVAEPRFLGYLRKALDVPTAAIVAEEIHKDWMPLPDAEIDRYVRDILEHNRS